MEYTLSFPTGNAAYYFNKPFSALQGIARGKKLVLITDSNVYELYKDLLDAYEHIIIPAGEQHKSLETVRLITNRLIGYQADKDTVLVGAGGGMITDLTGFAASVYMRGIPFGFVPTTLLGMTDAAIGGKNGVNFDLYKNMLGTIRQPSFILYDSRFLDTLPREEWSNGFAEIIKYACIFDPFLFSQLTDHDVAYYQEYPEPLHLLIQRCVDWKNRTVLADEQEQSVRRLLNFGHTVGHAIENRVQLPHGSAVGIGMMVACIVSEAVAGLSPLVTDSVKKLLLQYGLPTHSAFSVYEIMDLLKMDKKRKSGKIGFIVLEQIGKARVEQISLEVIEQALTTYAGNH